MTDKINAVINSKLLAFETFRRFGIKLYGCFAPVTIDAISKEESKIITIVNMEFVGNVLKVNSFNANKLGFKLVNVKHDVVLTDEQMNENSLPESCYDVYASAKDSNGNSGYFKPQKGSDKLAPKQLFNVTFTESEYKGITYIKNIAKIVQ
jgi:hypothetical protein